MRRTLEVHIWRETPIALDEWLAEVSDAREWDRHTIRRGRILDECRSSHVAHRGRCSPRSQVQAPTHLSRSLTFVELILYGAERTWLDH